MHQSKSNKYVLYSILMDSPIRNFLKLLHTSIILLILLRTSVRSILSDGTVVPYKWADLFLKGHYWSQKFEIRFTYVTSSSVEKRFLANILKPTENEILIES